MGAQDDQDQSRALSQLCSMIFEILKFPSFPVTCTTTASSSRQRRQQQQQPVATLALAQVSPTAFASLFMGVSLALMLFGTITFVVGFILMPWVFCLVLLFYFAAIVSHLSEFGKSIFCPVPRHHVPDWSFS